MCLCGIIIRNAKLTQQRLTRRYRQRDMVNTGAFPCSSRLLPMPCVVIRGHYKFLFLSLFGSPMATQFIFGVRGMRKIVQRYKKILNYPNFPKGKCENQYFLLLVSLFLRWSVFFGVGEIPCDRHALATDEIFGCDVKRILQTYCCLLSTTDIARLRVEMDFLLAIVDGLHETQ